MKKKEYYKIGEISSLYGISTDSLRYYEEIGILKPARDDNGYRMYTMNDIRTLNVLRELRSIGFSMKDIKDHLSNFDLEQTLSLFRKEIEVIDEKMAQLEKLRSQLSARIEEIENHKNSGSNAYALKKLPERRVLKLSENVYRDEDLDFVLKKLQTKNEDQLHLIGNSGIGATLPLSYLQNGNYGLYNSVFCITTDDEYDGTLSEGTYLTFLVKGPFEQLPSLWEDIFCYMESRCLEAAGDPIEIYAIDNHATNDSSEYITELQILVSPAS